MTTPTEAKPAAAGVPTAQLIAAMLKGREHISDLIFSPGHAPQIESSGQLVELKISGSGAPDARAHPPDRQRPDGRAQLRPGETGKGRLDRSLLLHSFVVQISRQHLPPARNSRHRHARDSQRRFPALTISSFRLSSRKSCICATESFWSPARPVPANRPRWPRSSIAPTVNAPFIS